MRFPIVTLIVLMITFLLIYSYANNQAKESYKKAFDLCLLQNNTQNPECAQSGGCFNPCGSACARPKQYFDLSDFFNKKQCIEACVPYCMQKPSQ